MKWRHAIAIWVLCLIFGFIFGVTPSFAAGFNAPAEIVSAIRGTNYSGTIPLLTEEMPVKQYITVFKDPLVPELIYVTCDMKPYIVNTSTKQLAMPKDSTWYYCRWSIPYHVWAINSTTNSNVLKGSGIGTPETSGVDTVLYTNYDLSDQAGSIIHTSDGNIPANDWGYIKFPIKNSNVTGYPDIVFHVNKGLQQYAQIILYKKDSTGKFNYYWAQPYVLEGIQGMPNSKKLNLGVDTTLTKDTIPYNGNGEYIVELEEGTVNSATQEFENQVTMDAVKFTIGGTEDNRIFIDGISDGDTFNCEPTCTVRRTGTYLKNQYQLFINGKLDSTMNAGKNPCGPQGYDVNGFHTFGFRVGSNTVEIKDMQGSVVKKVTFTIATGGVDIDPETGNPTNGVDPEDIKKGKPIRPDGSFNPLDWIIYFFDITAYYIDSLVSGIGKLITSLTTNGGAISNFMQKVFGFLPSPLPELMAGSIIVLILLKVFKR